MAKARAIVKRRKTVQNIRKITRTMQLIATARFQAAFNRATATKPYTQRITELVEQLSRGQGQVEHPLLRINTESNRYVHIVITSNRGFCGGYNAAILRTAMEHLRTAEAAGKTVDLHVVGRKGIGFFKFLNRPMASTETKFEDKPRFDDVNAIATQLMAAYEKREIDAVHVTYMKFMSAAVQRPLTMQLLPIERPAPAQDSGKPQTNIECEFTPPAPELLAELLPETVRVRLFQCFMEAAVSEQIARMVAMKSATDSAADMVKALTQQYNRARQSQITLELLDIVSGAEAIK